MLLNKKAKAFLSLLCAILAISITAISTAAWNGDVVEKVKTSDKKIALTFDDGPHPKRTPEILDILADYGVHATFFAIGKNVQAHPEIIKREIDEGHEIGNHTFTHRFLKAADKKTVDAEMCEFDDMMFEMFEYKPKLLRPPGGLYNAGVCSDARNLGYTVVLWSIDTRDWAHTSSEKICSKILSDAGNGDIILMHDYITGDSPTPSVLRTVIPALLDAGFDFVTVSEMMEEQ